MIGSLTMFAQTKSTIQSSLTTLEQNGWIIQHEVLSLDQQSIYFSALAPGQSYYNLYVSHRVRNRWSEPERMPASVSITTQNEFWPSISADEQELYFARQGQVDPKDRKATIPYDIYVCRRGINGWESAEKLVFSDGYCTCPVIQPDGETLFFAYCNGRPQEKHPRYGIYHTRKASKYHWLLPAEVIYPEENNTHFFAPQLTKDDADRWVLQYTRQTSSRRDTSIQSETVLLPDLFVPSGSITLTGQARDAAQKPLPAIIYVEDAITATRLATHKAIDQGTFTLSLPTGKLYNLDITAPGYSHRYLSYDTRSLSRDTVIALSLELTKNLMIQVNLFDRETHLPVIPEKVLMNVGNQRQKEKLIQLSLPINERCTIQFVKPGYETATLQLDTRKKVLLPSSVLDIEFSPGQAPVNILALDQETLDTIPAQIQINNLSHPVQQVAWSDTTYFRQGDRYEISLQHVGYFYCDTIVDVPLSPDLLTYTFYMPKMVAEMVLQLRNIHFEFGSSALTEDSYRELNKVVKLMRDNPELSIEISAHTDDQGSEDYNMRLSQSRGDEARRYIIRHGISSTRVVAKGYGMSQPLVPNTSDENRSINRRVEFKIIGLQ